MNGLDYIKASLQKWAWLVTAMSFVACTSSTGDLWNAHEKAKRGNEHKKAVHHLQKLVAKSDSDATKAKAHYAIADLYQYNLDQPEAALNHYRNALLYASDREEKIHVQEALADLLFGKLSDYSAAVVEYSLLADLLSDPSKKDTISVKVAKSHYHDGNLAQALDEANFILENASTEDTKYEATLLQANIYLAQKQIEKATSVFELLIERYPKKAHAEKIGLNLAMSYEELEHFDKAIATLENLKQDEPNSDHLQIRIDRMKRRQQSRPGAAGLKR